MGEISWYFHGVSMGEISWGLQFNFHGIFMGHENFMMGLIISWYFHGYFIGTISFSWDMKCVNSMGISDP